MTTHTPGPWEIWGGRILADRRALSVADARISNILEADEKYANAQLISAAPEMLIALQEADKHFGPFADITINGYHDPDDVRVVGLIRAAITKALGQ